MTASATTRKRCSCPDCSYGGRLQPITAFGANATSPDGYHWYCKACQNRKQREWKRANKKKVRKWKAEYDERNRQRNRQAA